MRILEVEISKIVIMKFNLLLVAYLAVACGLSNAAPAKTQEELENEMLHLQCPFGKKAAMVRGRCPTGARDPADCPAIRVECVDKSFGNYQPSTRPAGTGSTGPRKTQEELDIELTHKECPFGQRAALVKERCPSGALSTLDCPPMQVKCVQSSFGNTQPNIPSTNGVRPTAVPKTQEELEQEAMHKECPFGQRAALVKEKCPYGATDTRECPSTEVRCVQSSFGNDQPSTPRTGSSGPRAPQKTQEELDQEMSQKECPFGQRAAQVKEKCPNGGTDTLDCPPTDVRCVQSSFGNYVPSTPRTNSNGARALAKTQAELEQEMMVKVCPFGQRAALVKEKCPYGALNTLDCPPTEVRCVQSSFGNDQLTTTEKSLRRFQEENRWAIEHPGRYPGLPHGVNPFRNTYSVGR